MIISTVDIADFAQKLTVPSINKVLGTINNANTYRPYST